MRSFPNLFLATPLDHFTRRAIHFGCQGPLHGSDLGRHVRTDGDWVTPMCHDFGLLPGPSRLCEAPLRDSNTIDTGSCVELFSVVDGLCQVEQQRSSTAAIRSCVRAFWCFGCFEPLAQRCRSLTSSGPCTANGQHREGFV